MPDKTYGNCPTCGSTVEIYSGSEGTNSFIPTDTPALDKKLLHLKEQLERLDRDILANPLPMPIIKLKGNR